jgi:hypothetical protein
MAKAAEVKPPVGSVSPKRAARAEKGDEPQPRRWMSYAIGGGALALFFLTYFLRLDRAVGMFVDDSWYVVLAKALATGQGYELINSPSAGILPIYPPAFPWLLSLAYRLSPQFPQNLWLLKSISILAMCGVGLLAYYYFVRERGLPRYLSLGLALATALSPGFVFLATSSVMSGCVFTLGQLAAIVVIERGVRKGAHAGWVELVLGAGLVSFAFLTRSIGLGLIAAVGIYLLKERLWRKAVVFAGIVALLAGPWVLYARLHAPTAEQRAEQGSYVVTSYMNQLVEKGTEQASWSEFLISEAWERVWNHTWLLLEYQIGALGVYPLYRATEPAVGEGREAKTALLSFILSLLALAGFVAACRERITLAELVTLFTVLIAVVWTYPSYRFVLPLMPLMLFYMLLGLRAVCRLALKFRGSANRRRNYWPVLAGAVWCSAAISVYSNVTYIISLHGAPASRPVWVRAFEESEVMLRWANEHLPKDAVIAAQNPGLVYLYTGNKTVGNANPADNWERWKRLGVRHVALTYYRPLGEPTWAEKRYRILYLSDSMNFRIVDLGEAASRLPWADEPEDLERESRNN